MRTILLSKSDQIYLQKCATQLRFAYGIILGQLAEVEKYVIVHLAKNGEEEVDLPDDDETHEDAELAAQGTQSVEDIDTQALTNQWISASKMIPGSFTVLGVFVTGVKADIVEEATFKSAKKILYDVHNLLIQGNNFCGTVDNVASADYVFLAYSTSAKKAVCKSYSQDSNGGTFTPLDCRFVEKPFEWYTFECNYDLDDIFPIISDAQKVNIEHEFQRTLNEVKSNLQISEIFIQNEHVDDSLPLDAYIKKKKSDRKTATPAMEIYKASVFLPLKCQLRQKEPHIKVRKFNGTIRFAGVISSRVWCNAKNTLGDVKRFVRDDILRSLAARIQVYCDGLTEPNVNNDAIFISEPPRRVYFNLPTSPIQFSEYIFRGEAPTVAVAQAKQILDLDINTENIIADLENLPDDDFFSELSSEIQTAAAAAVPTTTSHDVTRTMYMLGIAVSLMVLLSSILLHYLLRE